MSRARAVSFVLVTALLLAAPALASRIDLSGDIVFPPRRAAHDVFADSLWDDGRAEITVYEGTIERYGVARPLAARIIVVKEDMDMEQSVKSAAGPVEGRTRPMLKQNLIRDFRTGTYDYHQMCSTFLDRRSGNVAKLVMSSSEGCGITFVELLPSSHGWDRVSHSYWDGEGDSTQHGIDGEFGHPGTPMDALPLWLRRLDLESGQKFMAYLLPSQVSNRVASLRVMPWQIEIIGRADKNGLPVLVHDRSDPGASRTDRYWFDPVWPHPLVRFEGGADATVLTRVKTTRLAYWEKTAPGDEKLIEP